MIQGPIVALYGLTPLIGWTLAHFLWQGALVALVLQLALRTCRTAKGRHDACLIALLTMVILPVATFLWLNGQVRVEVVAAGVPGLNGAAHLGWEPLAVAAWLVGVLALGGRTLGGLVLVERLRRGAAPLPSAWAERCVALQRRMGGRLKVVFAQSHAIATPLVAGWLKPMVLIPAAALMRLPADQLEALILHELAHVRRLDAFANLIQTVVETALFYHPAVWWVSRRLRIEREHCCDDLAVQVIRDPAVFVRALQAMEALRPAPCGVLAANGGSLKTRAARLLGMSTTPERPALSRTAAAVVLGLGALAMASALQVQANPAPAPAVAPVAEAVSTPSTADPRSTPAKATRRATAPAMAQAPATDAPAPKPVYMATLPSALVPGNHEADPVVDVDLTAARQALGPMPSDRAAQATWRAKSYALTAESDRRHMPRLQATLKNSQGVIGLAAANPNNDPTLTRFRLTLLYRLDRDTGLKDLYALHIHAAAEASDAYAAVDKLDAAATPDARAKIETKAANAARAVATLDQAIADKISANNRAIAAVSLSPEEFRSALRAITPITPALKPLRDLAYGVSAAAAAHRPMMANDYMWDIMNAAKAQGDIAEATARHLPPGSKLPTDPRPAAGPLLDLEERVRLERIAYAAIREGVEAGHRPQTDLDAAGATLKTVQEAYYDARDAVDQRRAGDCAIMGQRNAGEAVVYAAALKQFEARLPTASQADRPTLEEVVKRLHSEVHMHQIFETLARMDIREPPRPALPELPPEGIVP